ncbi:MAG TPA: type II secretion system F family protein [Actinomycetota bacterium]|nr:type II secretion system F family protein [Actinomycetota bacterium]
MIGAGLLAVGLWLLVPASVRNRLVRRAWPRPPWRARDRGRPAPAALIEVLSGFRDELLSGAPLRTAFERAAGTSAEPALISAVAACRLGGDVPQALRRAGSGRPALLALAALWEVCEGSGAALASALGRAVTSAEQAERVRREVQAQLSGPRSTVRVLALLPVVGVGMGVLMGADPLGFLLGTPWGWGCLLVAAGLEAAGVFWMRRLVAGIEAQL